MAPPSVPRPFALRLNARPLGTATVSVAFLASFAVLVRVLSSAYVDSWTGIGALALVGVALAAFGLHAWNLATGRGWKANLEGAGRSERLTALENLKAQGRIRPAEYLEERSRLLRGP